MADLLLMVAACVVIFLAVRWYIRGLALGGNKDKHVFITGCDTGFGNMLAKRLDSMGMNVFAGCLTSKGQEDLGMATSERLVAIPLDVTDGDSIQKAYKDVQKRLPKGKGLWGLVNNAGIGGITTHVEWQKIDAYRKCNDVNLYGLIHVTSVFLPLVRKSKGRIVNVTSTMGRLALVAAPYVVSKYGAEGFCDTLRYQLYNTGVSVHIIEPGFFNTAIANSANFEDQQRKGFASLDKERKEYYGERFLNDTLTTAWKWMDYVRSNDVYKVIDANSHALTAVYPRARYVVGWDGIILFRVLWNLPEWLGDWLIVKLLKYPVPEGNR